MTDPATTRRSGNRSGHDASTPRSARGGRPASDPGVPLAVYPGQVRCASYSARAAAISFWWVCVQVTRAWMVACSVEPSGVSA